MDPARLRGSGRLIERRGDSMSASVIGPDTATNVFQVHRVDERGQVVLRRRLRRGQLTDFFVNLPICTIGLEATQCAHHWARVLATFGTRCGWWWRSSSSHICRHKKNDQNDAAAIFEAISRPHMRFVTAKTIELQDLQTLSLLRDDAETQLSAL